MRILLVGVFILKWFSVLKSDVGHHMFTLEKKVKYIEVSCVLGHSWGQQTLRAGSKENPMGPSGQG